MNDGTGWNVAQRQVVAWLDVGRGTRLNDVALAELVRRDDVALCSINKVEEWLNFNKFKL